MEGDTPLSIYSFELAAIKQKEFRALVRPDPFSARAGTIFNFSGHRFRVTSTYPYDVSQLTSEMIEDAGFREGDGLTVRQKLERWLKQLGVNQDIIYLTLEPLERESNEPLT